MTGQNHSPPSQDESQPGTEMELSPSEYHGTFFEPNAVPDPDLMSKGWQKRFSADPHRAEETARLYKELGFEVQFREIDPADFSPVCHDCGLFASCNFVTLYTRRNKP